MVLFLTSSPTGDLDGKYLCEGFDTRNDFVEVVRGYWKENARVLMISAFPDNVVANAQMKGFFKMAILKSGLSLEGFDLWDSKVLKDEVLYSREVLLGYDVVILGGGHVPTQLHFFEELGLREKISDFEGMIIGISAGTMNCAETVYALPEEPGEAVDPSYQRFLQGLGLTSINVIPHFQLERNMEVDGLRIVEDLAIPDSIGRSFICLVDGSYIVQTEGRTEVRGEAYMIKDGVLKAYE